MWVEMDLSAGLMLLDAPSWLKDGDHAKLLLMAAVLVGLLLLGRWISARSETSAHDPQFMPDSNSPPMRPTAVAQPVDDDSDDEALLDGAPLAKGSAGDVHPAMDFGPVVLRKLYFHNFDALAGPADPVNFVDELTVEVLYKATGAVVENTYTVATPLGLNDLMTAKQWGVLYSPEVFIVSRFDLEEIRRAVLDNLLEHSETGSVGGRSPGEPLLG
jgi:hypothetical protein